MTKGRDLTRRILPNTIYYIVVYIRRCRRRRRRRRLFRRRWRCGAVAAAPAAVEAQSLITRRRQTLPPPRSYAVLSRHCVSRPVSFRLHRRGRHAVYLVSFWLSCLVSDGTAERQTLFWKKTTRKIKRESKGLPLSSSDDDPRVSFFFFSGSLRYRRSPSLTQPHPREQRTSSRAYTYYIQGVFLLTYDCRYRINVRQWYFRVGVLYGWALYIAMRPKIESRQKL